MQSTVTADQRLVTQRAGRISSSYLLKLANDLWIGIIGKDPTYRPVRDSNGTIKLPGNGVISKALRTQFSL
jgi:hypothetical protein